VYFKRAFLVVLLGAFSFEMGAQTCISLSTGNWNSAARWSCDGTNRLPACGDTIRVSSSHEITVSDQYNFSACGTTMAIDVYGTLTFTNGNKVDLPCGSLLSVQSGGTVRKTGSGGGSSTLVSICGSTVWSAGGINPLTGPIAYGGDVLPIELLSFSVYDVEGETMLTWKTASEVDNDFFTILTSKDGTSWNEIYEQPGAGNSSVIQAYEVLLQEAFTTKMLFRLDQTDYNGETRSVGLAELDYFDGPDPLQIAQVYPNPTSGNVQVVIAAQTDQVSLGIYTLDGRLVYQYNRISVPLFSFDVREALLSPGVYVLTIKDGSKSQRLRLSVSE